MLSEENTPLFKERKRTRKFTTCVFSFAPQKVSEGRLTPFNIHHNVKVLPQDDMHLGLAAKNGPVVSPQ